MTTVPLAITGALIGLYVFGSTINIYSQIGAVMLIGLAAKNGILIVEFANQLRDRGVEFKEAVVQSAKTRLRPVLMTSMCTAFGAIPLILASGAGALSRRSIGAVVFFGVSFSVVLTLVVVPAVYSLIAKNSHSPEYVSQLIDKLSGKPAEAPARLIRIHNAATGGVLLSLMARCAAVGRCLRHLAFSACRPASPVSEYFGRKAPHPMPLADTKKPGKARLFRSRC